MRRVADALGVTAMALYKHVRNREELVSGMVDAALEPVLADEPAAEPASGSWRDQATRRILDCRAAVSRQPWLQAAIVQQTLASPVALAYMDQLIRILRGGLPVETGARHHARAEHADVGLHPRGVPDASLARRRGGPD